MVLDDATVTCAWVQARVEDYLDGADGSLAPEERSALARHAARCASCRVEIDAARTLLSELRAFPVFEAPPAVIAAAERAIAAPGRVVPLRGTGRARAVVQWAPAAVAAAALLALVLNARWSGPVATEPSALADASVVRAARETELAFSYINRCARITGDIVAGEIMEKRVFGTVERAIDEGVVNRGIAPPLRRVMKKRDLVETNPPQGRS